MTKPYMTHAEALEADRYPNAIKIEPLPPSTVDGFVEMMRFAETEANKWRAWYGLPAQYVYTQEPERSTPS